MKKFWQVGSVALVVSLAGCAEREIILPGERLGLRDPLENAAAQTEQAAADTTSAMRSVAGAENRSVPIQLPAQVSHSAWTHKGGTPSHFIQHSAFSTAPQLVFAANIGQGSDRRHRITATPVASAGAIFTLDSRAGVTATAESGKTLWSRDLTPANERADDASGGGLAVSGSTLFVTTGFGELVALDAGSGDELWTQKLDAPATGAPTVFDGVVYVSGSDSRAWAVRADSGRVMWQLPGLPSQSALVGGAGPAVTDRLAVFPFSSGELVATLRQGGVRVWESSVSGRRKGRAYGAITDIVADPVVVGDTIFTANQSGRAVALNLSDGTRNWTANEGALGPVTVAGGAVFLVSDQGELVRLDAATGERIWGVELPYFTNDRLRRRRDVFAHFGPVLAGGLLWVASSDGQLRGFGAEDGTLANSVELPGGAATAPIVVKGVMYVAAANGRLLAFR